jgi:hypothetical protein
MMEIQELASMLCYYYCCRNCFDTCLKNVAAVNPGTSSLVQTHASSIQENSLSTDVKPEAEIHVGSNTEQ